ncbi:MAG: hypothetical protein ABWK01_06905, partial [Infirmifilum sp.]
YWACYKLPSVTYKLLGQIVWLYPIIAALLAPFRGLYLALKTGDLNLLPYWIVRRYSFLYGVLIELRRAFIAQGAFGD